MRTPTLLAFLLTQLLALGAAAQSDAEFGRASGGSIKAITKGARRTSGSLGLSHSIGALRGQGYEGSLGGELIADRLWFFGSAAIAPTRMQFSSDIRAVDVKATAQPVDWTSVTASFTRLQQPAFEATLPSSFLSLRSTSVLSDRMTLDFRFSSTQ